jgi:hypothetical protein
MAELIASRAGQPARVTTSRAAGLLSGFHGARRSPDAVLSCELSHAHRGVVIQHDNRCRALGDPSSPAPRAGFLFSIAL